MGGSFYPVRSITLNIGPVDHIAINCLDFGKSVDFYGRILGFEQKETVDMGGFAITYFLTPAGARIELFDYHGQNQTVARAESDSGLRHMAFQVRDVSAHEQILRAAGVEISLPTCDLPNLGARVLLFLDPNGVTIEFCESL